MPGLGTRSTTRCTLCLIVMICFHMTLTYRSAVLWAGGRGPDPHCQDPGKDRPEPMPPPAAGRSRNAGVPNGIAAVGTPPVNANRGVATGKTVAAPRAPKYRIPADVLPIARAIPATCRGEAGGPYAGPPARRPPGRRGGEGIAATIPIRFRPGPVRLRPSLVRFGFAKLMRKPAKDWPARPSGCAEPTRACRWRPPGRTAGSALRSAPVCATFWRRLPLRRDTSKAIASLKSSWMNAGACG